jgi:nucleotide-binding universal stress UspA family protein
MYRHILVPTDGSELSNNAIEHAVALAKALKAKLTVLTVSIPYYAFAVEPELPTVGIEEYEKASRNLAAQHFDIARKIAGASDVACETIHF